MIRNQTKGIEEIELALLGPIFDAQPGRLAYTQIDSLISIGFDEECFAAPSTKAAWRLIMRLKKDEQLSAEVIMLGVNEGMEFGLSIVERSGWWGEVTQYNCAGTMMMHGKMLMAMRQKREAMELASDMVIKSKNPLVTADDVLETYEDGIREIKGLGAQVGDPKEKAVAELHEWLDAADAGKPVGNRTGVSAWDSMLNGLQPGLFYIVAGLPSCAKTSLAEQIIMSFLREGKAVGYFQRELSDFRAVGRLAARLAGITWSDAESGRINTADRMALRRGVDAVKAMPVHLASIGRVTGGTTRALIEKWKRVHDIQLIVFDYIQLVEEKREQDRRGAVAELSHNLRRCANDLKIPVIALSQFRRETEHEKNRRPRKSDLRECSDLEADADCILGLWHQGDRGNDSRWPITWTILKNRSGPLAEADVMFDGPSMTFLGEKTNEEQRG